VNEQRRNVYENKGPEFVSLGLGGNVIENKDSYASKAGMLLKRNRIQDSGFRRQESGRNFDNASAGASRAANSFTPLDKMSLRKAKGKAQ